MEKPMPSDTPEEKNQPSPSPEARVDWEKEARETCSKTGGHTDMGDGKPCVSCVAIAKALSAAFEKGREAR